MSTNFTIADWIAGTAILLATLIIPFAIRRWIVRRPLSKITAGLIAFGIWLGLFSFFWWAASLADLQEAYSRKPHLGILAIAVISYWMLTSASKNTPQRADDGSSSGDSSLGTESRRTAQIDPKRAAAAMRKHRATAPPETVVSKQMNWTRGLLRLWLIAACFWIAWANIVAVLDSSMKWRECEVTNTTGIECLIESLVFTRDGELPNLAGWILILSVPVVVLGVGMAIAWAIGGLRDSNRDTN